jgi:hypothetical protein
MSTTEHDSFVEGTANGVIMQHLVKCGLFKDTKESKEFVRQNEARIKALVDQTMNLLREQQKSPKTSAKKPKKVFPTKE